MGMCGGAVFLRGKPLGLLWVSVPSSNIRADLGDSSFRYSDLLLEERCQNGIPCMQNLKGNDVVQINLLQNRNGLIENKLVAGCWRGRDSEFGMDMYTLLSLKWITKKDLLYSTWNSAQYYVAAWMGREFGGEWTHRYVWLSFSAVHLKLSLHW